MNNHLLTALNCSIVAGLAFLFSSRAEAQSGGMDTTFKPGFDGDVFSIRIQPNDKLLVSGFFSKVGSTSRSGIARLNSDGSLDTSFNPGSGAFNTIFNQHGLVETLALQRDGRVVVAGRFQLFNGVARNYIARLNGDGSLDNAYAPALSDIAVTLALQPDGKILVGGEFLSVNGTPRNRIARLNADSSLDLTFNPGAGPDKGVNKFRMTRPDGSPATNTLSALTVTR